MFLKLIHLIHKTETKRLNNQLKAVYSGPEFRLGTLAHIEAVLKSYHERLKNTSYDRIRAY